MSSGGSASPRRGRGGGRITLRGLGEEAAKLLPLAVLAVAAPGRVRRFSVSDWLIAGFAAGLAFQLAEELARRTVANVRRPGLLDVILGGGDVRGSASGFAQYGLSPLGGWSSWSPGTQFPGHHAMTALVAVCLGLGTAAWRHARRASASGPALAWRVLGEGRRR